MVLDGFGLIIRLKGCNLEVGNDVFMFNLNLKWEDFFFFFFFNFSFVCLGLN